MNKKSIIFLIIGIVIVIFVVAPMLYKTLSGSPSTVVKTVRNTFGQCESNPNPVLTHDITDFDKIGYIVPPGNVEEYPGSENVFKTHSYIKGPNKVPIYAPIDSTLYSGVYVTEGGINQYGLWLEASCEVFYILDHVVDVPDKIKNVFPDTPTLETNTVNIKRTEIKAGELVGYSIGPAFEQWDFGIYNKNKEQEHSEVNAKVYSRDKIADCPYDYYPEEKKKKYYSLFQNHLSDIPTPTRFCKP